MQLRDLSLVDKRNETGIGNDFERFAIQIVELYLSFIYRKVSTDAVVKVIIQLVPVELLRQPRDLADELLVVDWPFDFQTLTGEDDDSRKRIILDEIHGALTWVAQRHGWDEQPFKNAYERSLEAGVRFRGLILSKWVPHPILPISANCEFEFDAEKVHVYVVLRYRNNQIGRKYAYWTPVREDVVRRLLDRIEWVGRNHRQIKTFPGRGSWGEQSAVVDVGEIIDSAETEQNSTPSAS